ncbi:MAG: pinensin family lanthipeptide [Acidobacteriota bacterium]|nr:pinensin family lanthipeptide [Acidobacteriota bacterium]
MKKKLSLDQLSVKSFITRQNAAGGAVIQPEPTGKLCTRDLIICPWYSELYTACECPESEWEPCLSFPNCV